MMVDGFVEKHNLESSLPRLILSSSSSSPTEVSSPRSSWISFCYELFYCESVFSILEGRRPCKYAMGVDTATDVTETNWLINRQPSLFVYDGGLREGVEGSSRTLPNRNALQKGERTRSGRNKIIRPLCAGGNKSITTTIFNEVRLINSKKM